MYFNCNTTLFIINQVVQYKSSSAISYKYGDNWYTAKMISKKITNPITSGKDLVTATTSVFN